MKLSNFNYDLPKELLAEYPSDQRDESKLMVLNRETQKIEHKLFKDIIDYFDDGDVFVLNDTKVFPARLMGNKERYQTIYAKNEGAVAAPTAGLHFSKHLLKRLQIKGVNLSELTLHVGLGTFNPVEVEDLSKHKMDSEELFINQSAVDIVNQAKLNKKKVCAVGTTVMRGLESSVSSIGTLNPYVGWTHKFIFPPYDFNIANSLITNFHMPKSTLLMMVSAFAGHDFMMDAYQEAIKKKYRFYSYGDAMLII